MAELSVKLLIQMAFLMLLFINESIAQNRSVALPGCQETCGSLVVPYPFGIGPNCSAVEQMRIYCNTSSNPPKAFIQTKTLVANTSRLGPFDQLQVLEIRAGTILVNHPITRECTNTSKASRRIYIQEPFSYSNTENRFTAMACNNLALLQTLLEKNSGGCVSMCQQQSSTKEDNNSCLGVNCCQIKFLPSLHFLSPSFSGLDGTLSTSCSEGPRYAFIADHKWFGGLKDINSVKKMEAVPVVLNWGSQDKCMSFGLGDSDFTAPNGTWCGKNAFCTNQSLCSCIDGYGGNPYLQDGCQDINECEDPTLNSCEQHCNNTLGSYICSCAPGYILLWNSKCIKLDLEVDHAVKKVVIKVIASCSGLGLLLATTFWLYKVIRQRKIRKLKEKFFRRNGGLLLHQKVSSSEGNVETTKLFTSKELEKATDQYNVDRIVGQGGQGTVYKGMLTDGRIVAVKKSKIEDESKIEHFINEVVILSQINHRNIVKLHGCCLETQVPLLVYEFIPNGTLMQYIHEQNENFPLTWDVRKRVATEVARALYYLHSAASIPIYHRDIKSSNILLDHKYTAKVADFGTSRSISIDQTHLTTKVQGTFGYLDPEYFQSSQFTEKSDVYSFGVVLVELLTGQKPISAARLDDEARSLATHFLFAMEENRVLDILDSRITNEDEKEEKIAFANIAYRCLNLNGRRRPTMKQVVAELESISNTNGSPSAQQNYEEVEYKINELYGPWDSDLTSSSMNSTVFHSLNVDVQPLMTE